jgi:hypothetical protein
MWKNSLSHTQLDIQLMTKFFQFRGKLHWTFVYTVDCQCSLFWARCIQSTPFYSIPNNFNFKIILGPPCGPLTFKNRASYIYIYRTGVPLPSRCCILYFFSTIISTEYFKHAAHFSFFFSKCRLFHNAIFFGSCIIHILHTGCAKI